MNSKEKLFVCLDNNWKSVREGLVFSLDQPLDTEKNNPAILNYEFLGVDKVIGTHLKEANNRFVKTRSN